MKAIGYIRISDEDQSNYSLDFQRLGIQGYCSRYGLTMVTMFEDNGQKSYTFDRKGFNALEDQITKEKPQYLIVYNLDRFSRNMAEAMLKIRSLLDIGIKVRDLSEPIDLDDYDPNTFLMRAVKFMNAEMELHRIHQRTKSGMLQAALSGRHANMAPYGYTNARDQWDKPILEIAEEKASIVRMIFREFINGLSFTEIRAIAKLHGYKQTGHSAIKNILENPIYAGLIRVPATNTQPARLVPGLHTALVSEQDYWLTQEQLQGPGKKIHDNEEVPLRGVLHCWCGAKMTAGNSRSRSGKYYWYYLCQVHRKNFSATQLHATFQEILDNLSISEDALKRLREKLSAKVQDHINTKEAKVRDVRKQLEQIELKIEQAERKYLTGKDISEKTYLKVNGELKAERTRLYQQLAKLNTNEKAYFERLNVALNAMFDIKKEFDKLPLVKKHQFIELVFDKDFSYEDGSYRTAHLLEIFEHNTLILKKKGLLKISSPVINLGETPVRTRDGNIIEQLDRLASILIA